MDNKKTVLLENEKYANKVMFSALRASGVALIIVWVLLEVGVLATEKGVPRITIFSSLLLMIIALTFIILLNGFIKRLMLLHIISQVERIGDNKPPMMISCLVIYQCTALLMQMVIYTSRLL